MKIAKVATCVLTVLLFAPVAFAQHGHGGGATGSGMGNAGNAGNDNAMGHSAASGHGNSSNGNSGNLGSAHGQTVNDILGKNTQLADKISKLTGESAIQACSGFKNLGQCVAAAHVANNLGLTFGCLKSDMNGTAPPQGVTCPANTGAKSMSLGKAIQTLDPKANQKDESKKGETQAQDDLKGSNS